MLGPKAHASREYFLQRGVAPVVTAQVGGLLLVQKQESLLLPPPRASSTSPRTIVLKILLTINLKINLKIMNTCNARSLPRYLQATALLVFVLLLIITTIVFRPHEFSFIGNDVELLRPFKSVQDSTPDLLPIERAQDYCQTRRWEAYPIRDQKRKVYDLFMINTEVDWLEIRMGELAEQVDYFIILESSVDFKDRPKPLYVQDNWSRFASFHQKMIHHILNVTGRNFRDAWDREHFSRNAMLDQVFPNLVGDQIANLGDVILVSDVDEIPRADTVKALRNCQFPRRLTLRTDYYRYSFQWLLREAQWAHPQATFYDGPDTIKPENLRMSKTDGELYNAGWHCSSCLATLEDMVNKVTSFSHSEFNTPDFTDRSKILQRVRQGRDPYNRTAKTYDRIDRNPDVPQYLLDRPEEFAYLIDRDPPNANFKDVNDSDLL